MRNQFYLAILDFMCKNLSFLPIFCFQFAHSRGSTSIYSYSLSHLYEIYFHLELIVLFSFELGYKLWVTLQFAADFRSSSCVVPPFCSREMGCTDSFPRLYNCLLRFGVSKRKIYPSRCRTSLFEAGSARHRWQRMMSEDGRCTAWNCLRAKMSRPILDLAWLPQGKCLFHCRKALS